jgi:hypothetical protein
MHIAARLYHGVCLPGHIGHFNDVRRIMVSNAAPFQEFSRKNGGNWGSLYRRERRGDTAREGPLISTSSSSSKSTYLFIHPSIHPSIYPFPSLCTPHQRSPSPQTHPPNPSSVSSRGVCRNGGLGANIQQRVHVLLPRPPPMVSRPPHNNGLRVPEARQAAADAKGQRPHAVMCHVYLEPGATISM